MNELEQRAKQHKKRQRGLALSYLNTDAGNVEYNVNMFNKMNSPIDGPSNNPVSGPFGGDVNTSTGGEGSAMGESLTLDEALKTGMTYMLRNDGTLIEVKGTQSTHPYIIQINSDPIFRSIRDLIITCNGDPLIWFYENTVKNDTKELIKHFVECLIPCQQYYTITIPVHIMEYFKPQNAIATPDNEDELNTLINYLETTIKFLNEQTNQEFCRMRTSHLFRPGFNSNDIYFRISSTNFNWFNLIWQLVYDNKNWIQSVTITGDPSAKGNSRIYNVKGIDIDHLSTNEFINLPGNPLIEEFITSSFNYCFEEGYFNGYYGRYNPLHVIRHSQFRLNEMYNTCFIEKEPSQMLKEANENKLPEMIDLEYEDISVTVYGEQRDADDWDEWEVTTDWTYKVEKNDIEVLIIENYLSDEDLPNRDDLSDDEIDKFVSEHFDELFEKYESKIKDHYCEDACEDAQERYEYEPDYPEYDPYDEEHLWEELHRPIRKNSVLDEGMADDNFNIFLRTI